jgi:hypothetical protein
MIIEKPQRIAFIRIRFDLKAPLSVALPTTIIVEGGIEGLENDVSGIAELPLLAKWIIRLLVSVFVDENRQLQPRRKIRSDIMRLTKNKVEETRSMLEALGYEVKIDYPI